MGSVNRNHNHRKWGGLDEAAWLFPQQRILSGQNSREPEGFAA
jgi:hypothetical protein